MHGVSGHRSLGPTTGWLASISTAELHLQGKLLVAAAGAAAAGGELRTQNQAAGREGVYRCDRGRGHGGKGVKN